MANPIFNMINGINLINQVNQLQNNPAQILNILLRNGKINQQQYNELQQYGNNPQQIFNYLMNHGKADQLNQAQQTATQIQNQYINNI